MKTYQFLSILSKLVSAEATTNELLNPTNPQEAKLCHDITRNLTSAKKLLQRHYKRDHPAHIG